MHTIFKSNPSLGCLSGNRRAAVITPLKTSFRKPILLTVRKVVEMDDSQTVGSGDDFSTHSMESLTELVEKTRLEEESIRGRREELELQIMRLQQQEALKQQQALQAQNTQSVATRGVLPTRKRTIKKSKRMAAMAASAGLRYVGLNALVLHALHCHVTGACTIPACSPSMHSGAQVLCPRASCMGFKPSASLTWQRISMTALCHAAAGSTASRVHNPSCVLLTNWLWHAHLVCHHHAWTTDARQ